MPTKIQKYRLHIFNAKGLMIIYHYHNPLNMFIVASFNYVTIFYSDSSLFWAKIDIIKQKVSKFFLENVLDIATTRVMAIYPVFGKEVTFHVSKHTISDSIMT